MKLHELIERYEVNVIGNNLEVSGSIQDLEVNGLSFDSRDVKTGNLYFCITGETHDGHDFAHQAEETGAVAIVVERTLQTSVPQIVVQDTREAMGHISCVFYGYPSNELKVIGVTGTNGKTTTVHLISDILNASGVPSQAIGTLTGQLTTPEAPKLQSKFRTIANSGAEAIVMEVSSHALSQHRTTGIEFDIGVFTNLTHDHLDYHTDIDEYFQTKCSLFEPKRCKAAVINTDDPYGSRLVEGITIEAVEVSRKMIEVTDERFTGSTLLWDGQKVNLAIPGRFNIDNTLLAISTCQQLGIGQEDIISGLEAAKPVSGRFEVIEGGEGEPTIIVDYSHTPAGIENVLQAVRWIDPTVPLTVIFGCGGDRDRSKRPEMARAAESYADQVIITSDNPRNEDPKKIIEEAMAGFKKPDVVTVEIDRKLAIQTTINSAQAGEVIVIAGKGAETTQQIGDKLVPFDDRVIAREALRGGAV